HPYLLLQHNPGCTSQRAHSRMAWRPPAGQTRALEMLSRLPRASAEGQRGEEPWRLPDPRCLLEGECQLDERCLAEVAPDKGDVHRQPGREARRDADERVPDARSG